MKTLSVSLAALAVATMAATGSSAQTLDETAYDAPERTVVETMQTRWYDADRATYAVLDEERQIWMIYDANSDEFVRTAELNDYEPYEAGRTDVRIGTMTETAYDAPDRKVLETMDQRYWSEDRASYAIFDPVKSVWNVFDATTDAVLGVFDDDDFEPEARGYAMAEAPDTMNDTAYDAPERAVVRTLEAGDAEERYYDAERRTYAVWDDNERTWGIFDAETEELIRTDAGYDRYEPGYTVVVPGSTEVGMGAEGESISAETQGISDNRQ